MSKFIWSVDAAFYEDIDVDNEPCADLTNFYKTENAAREAVNEFLKPYENDPDYTIIKLPGRAIEMIYIRIAGTGSMFEICIQRWIPTALLEIQTCPYDPDDDWE